MKVFISWSGDKSKVVANALRTLVQDVVRSAQPWVSEGGIQAGTRWSAAIQSELEQTKFGIVCLTKANLGAPWVNFEAGALAKTIQDTFVCPYLIDLRPEELPQGPLAQFQAKRATKDDTLALLQALNGACGASRDPDADVDRRFGLAWPDYDSVLTELPKTDKAADRKRTVDEMVSETLLAVRQLGQQLEEWKNAQPDIIGRAVLSARQGAGLLSEQPDPHTFFLTGKSQAGKTLSSDLVRQLLSAGAQQPQIDPDTLRAVMEYLDRIRRKRGKDSATEGDPPKQK